MSFGLSRQDRDGRRRLKEAAAEADARSLRRRSVPEDGGRADGEVGFGVLAQADARHGTALTFAHRRRGAERRRVRSSLRAGRSLAPVRPRCGPARPARCGFLAGRCRRGCRRALAAGTPLVAGEVLPVMAERRVRIRVVPEAGTGGGTGADADDSAPLVPVAMTPAPSPAAVDPAAGPDPGCVVGAATSDGPGPDRSEPRRLTATPLAMSTTRADATASPTNAPRRSCSAKKVLPQYSPGEPNWVNLTAEGPGDKADALMCI